MLYLFLCDYESNIINYADDTTVYACEPNVEFVMSKLEKDACAVFIWFRNNYSKTNNGKYDTVTLFGNVLHINVDQNRLSSSKQEELLGIIINHKLTFEDHLLNIVQKINQ